METANPRRATAIMAAALLPLLLFGCDETRSEASGKRSRSGGAPPSDAPTATSVEPVKVTEAAKPIGAPDAPAHRPSAESPPAGRPEESPPEDQVAVRAIRDGRGANNTVDESPVLKTSRLLIQILEQQTKERPAHE